MAGLKVSAWFQEWMTAVKFLAFLALRGLPRRIASFWVALPSSTLHGKLLRRIVSLYVVM